MKYRPGNRRSRAGFPKHPGSGKYTDTHAQVWVSVGKEPGNDFFPGKVLDRNLFGTALLTGHKRE